MNDTMAVRKLPARRRHVVPVKWRYGAEHDDVGEVLVEGYDAPRFVEDVDALLALRDAVIGLTTGNGPATHSAARLAELRAKALKLVHLDAVEG